VIAPGHWVTTAGANLKYSKKSDKQQLKRKETMEKMVNYNHNVL